ncbi:MAG: Rid family hydrolase [Patescibacteria group bacterium]
MPKKEIVFTFPGDDKLPYSTVVKIGDHYHFSGVVPEVSDGRLASPGDVESQINEVFKKIKHNLSLCGLRREDVYSATVMLSGSMQHFPLVNKIYSDFFNVSIKPRRKAFAVAALPFGAEIEIEIDAIKQSK